jgi:hypothetical protein
VKDQFRCDRGVSLRVEEKPKVSVPQRRHEGCQPYSLVHGFGAKRNLNKTGAVAHDGGRGAAGRPADFEDRGSTGGEAEATGADAKVARVAQFHHAERAGRFVVGDREGELDGHAAPQPLGAEAGFERDCGCAARRGGQADDPSEDGQDGPSSCARRRPSGHQYESFPVVWTTKASVRRLTVP